jgi:hypothetical protein
VTVDDALRFVEQHGIVLQAARGAVPNLAEAIAGGRIRGSWWGHPKGNEIYAVLEAVSDSPEVLVCKLVDGKITYIHRRLWPALIKLAPRFRREQLAKVWNEHTVSGRHRSRRQAFPAWVPDAVMRQSEELPIAEAEEMLQPWLVFGKDQSTRSKRG